MENIEKELELNEDVVETEVIEENSDCTDMCEYEEPEEDSSLGNVIAGVAVAGAAVVGGIVLKKYGPKIKGYLADKHQKHLAKKDKKAMAYLAARGVTGEDLDMMAAKKVVEDTPIEKIPVEKIEDSKEEKKETKKKTK